MHEICDYSVMGHIFYDIFSIINVSFMQLMFNLATPKSTVYKMEVTPMILEYYCLET